MIVGVWALRILGALILAVGLIVAASSFFDPSLTSTAAQLGGAVFNFIVYAFIAVLLFAGANALNKRAQQGLK